MKEKNLSYINGWYMGYMSKEAAMIPQPPQPAPAPPPQQPPTQPAPVPPPAPPQAPPQESAPQGLPGVPTAFPGMMDTIPNPEGAVEQDPNADQRAKIEEMEAAAEKSDLDVKEKKLSDKLAANEALMAGQVPVKK